MESAGEAKVFSSYDDKAAAETSFRQFLDDNAREQGGIFVRFMHLIVMLQLVVPTALHG